MPIGVPSRSQRVAAGFVSRETRIAPPSGWRGWACARILLLSVIPLEQLNQSFDRRCHREFFFHNRQTVFTVALSKISMLSHEGYRVG